MARRRRATVSKTVRFQAKSGDEGKPMFGGRLVLGHWADDNAIREMAVALESLQGLNGLKSLRRWTEIGFREDVLAVTKI
jgi:hypothetical protein